MRIKAAVVLAFILLPAALSSQPAVSVDSSQVLATYDFFSSLYPRSEGDDGERDALNYSKGILKRWKIPFTESSFQEMEGAHSFSRNLEVTIPGARGDQLIFAVPLSQEENALKGKDGSINLALALALIEEFHGTQPPVSLKFLFLGGEYDRDVSYPLGITQFLDEFFPEDPVAVMYVNFREIPETIVIRSGGRYVTAPYWLLERTSSALSVTELSYRLMGNEHQVFRIGLTDTVTPIEPFLVAEYPSIELTGEGSVSGKREAEAWIQSYVQFVHQLMETNEMGFPEEWDKHYLFFQFGTRRIIIRETSYLLILMGIFALFFLYSVLFRHRIMRYLRILVKHLDALPVVFLFIFLCLLVSGLFLEGITFLKGYREYWMSLPFLFFLLKISTALFLFFLTFRYLRRRYFSIRGSFYSAAALLFLLLTTITTAVINISFSYYFAWAFIWTFVFTLFKRRSLKLICLILSPVWLFKALYDVFTLPSLKVVDMVLFSRFPGNLLVALFLLPFVLKLIRLSLLHKHAVGRKLGRQNIIILVFFGVLSVSITTYLLMDNPWEKAKQPAAAVEYIDGNTLQRYLKVSSAAPLQPFTVTGSGYRRSLDGGEREVIIRGERAPDLLTVEQQAERFLDRTHYIITVSPEGDPDSIFCTVEGEEEIILFDANFPYSIDPTGTKGTLFIGKNPPVPLSLEFTLPQETKAVLQLEVVYDDLPYELELAGGQMEFETSLHVKKELSLLEYSPPVD